MHHQATVSLADRLMTQADAKQRDLWTELANQVERDAGVDREAGPGEITMRSGASARISSTVILSLR